MGESDELSRVMSNLQSVHYLFVTFPAASNKYLRALEASLTFVQLERRLRLHNALMVIKLQPFDAN